MPEITDQQIVDTFALLLTGSASLEPTDPRAALVTIAQICLEQFVGITRFGYENGHLTEPASNGFEPTFPRSEDDKK